MKVQTSIKWRRLWLFIMFVFCTICCNQIEARHFMMLPLKPREVYRLLRLSAQEDAIPEGRIITQGLALVGGFAAGLTKAIGATFLYEIITANVTGVEGLEWYNDMWSGGSSSSNNNSNTEPTEICFNTRSARSLEEADAIAEAYNRDDSQSESAMVRKSDVKRTKKIKNRRKKPGRRRKNKHKKDNRFQLSISAADDGANDGTNVGIINVEDINVGTNDGDAINTDEQTKLGSGTTSSSTTSTSPEGAINCIVIVKSRH